MPKHVTFKNTANIRVMKPYPRNERGVRVNQHNFPIDHDDNLLFQTAAEQNKIEKEIISRKAENPTPRRKSNTPKKTVQYLKELTEAEDKKEIANALASNNVIANAKSRADRIQRLVGVPEAEFNRDQMKYFGKILEYGGFPVSIDRYLEYLESHPGAAKSGGKRKTRKRTVRRTRKH